MLPTVQAQTRTHQRSRTTPGTAGLPDPRPVTGFTAEYGEEEGRSMVLVTLDAPCIVRNPMWSVIDVADGSSIGPVLGKLRTDSQIVFRFDDLLPPTACFIDVPYQDMQVQNYFGGFVRPGATWFRPPG